jgi:phage gp36-like protein
MTLTEEDGRLFYELWFPLLDYVNKKKKVNKGLKDMAHAKELDPMDVREIADVLWDDVAIIDEYLMKREVN